MELANAARAFSALSNEGRLAIFRLIVRAGPRGLPSGEVARRAGKVPNSASSSLRILAEAGLIVARRQGRSVIYAAVEGNLPKLLEALTVRAEGEAAHAEARPGPRG